MSKLDVHEGDKYVLGPSTTTADGLPESSNDNSEPSKPHGSFTSSRDSASEIPFPFGSQSSIDEEIGNRKTECFLIIH